MALIAGRMTLAGRAEADGATRLRLAASAEAAADGAVYEAIFHVTQKDLHWAPDRIDHKITIGHVEVDVRLEDESGKINPNIATPELLAVLFTTAGVDTVRAHDLSRAIVDWRDTKPTAEAAARGAASYHMNGLDYAPAHEVFHFLDELGAVIGMSPTILAAILPHMTLYSDKGPVAARADPIVRAAMKLAAVAEAPTPSAAPDQSVFTINANATGPDATAFRRRAVVQVDGKGNYMILAWDIAPGR